MVGFADTVSFLLNDRRVDTAVPSALTALDFLRSYERLTGTKEGCKEGDCGACTVIVGSLQTDGTVRYEPVTSCLLPMGELHGKHLVTVEGLLVDGKLSPVQEAMVDCGGTQCGYCTPGFVVAMTAGLIDPKLPLNEDGLLYAISGNLCRCTGYRSIKEAGLRVIESLRGKLGEGSRVAELVASGALPGWFNGVAGQLGSIPARVELDSEPGDDVVVLAGGTDLFVQRGEELPERAVRFLNRQSSRSAPGCEQGKVRLDARMTFEEFVDDPEVRRNLGRLPEWNLLISSWPVRTRATLGGNLCNASPIADLTCLFLALGAEVVLERNGRSRTLPLREFYTGYKQLNREPGEVVTSILFPHIEANEYVNWEKVSKRSWLDIATVNSAIRLRVEGGIIAAASLSLGGVAATPLWLEGAEACLCGKQPDTTAVAELLIEVDASIRPISDVRGSADYKRLLARQLVLAHFVEFFGSTIVPEEVYAAL